MQTLANGIKKPEDGDRGSVFWDALAENMEQIDGHAHDGSDSAAIPGYNITRTSISVPTTDFSVSGSRYRATVTITNWNYTTANLKFLCSGGDYANREFFPEYERITNTTFYLYMPVNTQAVTVVVS